MNGLFVCERRHLCPIATHHCLLLRSTPTLDLTFGGQRFISAREFLRKRQRQWSTRTCVSRNFAGLVCVESRLKIVRVPRVVRTIGTPQNVDPEGHYL